MKTQSPDTSPEAERALIEITRRLSPERKLQPGFRRRFIRQQRPRILPRDCGCQP